MSGNGLGVRRIRSGLNISGSGWGWVKNEWKWVAVGRSGWEWMGARWIYGVKRRLRNRCDYELSKNLAVLSFNICGINYRCFRKISIKKRKGITAIVETFIVSLV